LNAKFDDPTGTTSQYLRGDGSLATFPSLTGYVPYTGATTNVNLGEYEIKAGQLTLDTSPTGTAAVGTTRWNDTIGSSETTLKGGSVILKNGVDLVARVVNKVTPNTTLTKAAYQAVRVSGAQGQRLAVAFAQANNDANSADTIGLVCETIATNQEGFIMTVGQLENINTTGSLQGETWVDGDVLYLSPTTAGAITKVKPTGNGHIVVIGYVEYAHANNGKIYLKVMNGWELDELHDVSITSVANNEALIYESATALWKNKSIATALGYTPANAATTLTINGVTYDLSTSRTWTVAGGISGSGASGQVAYWDGTTSQAGSNNLFWDNANGRLGIGTNTPVYRFDITSPNIRIANFSGTNTSARLSINNTTTTPNVGIGLYANNIIKWSLASYGATSDFTFFNDALNSDAIFIKGSTNNVILGGSTTDNGQKLQVQGTTLLNGNVTFSSATGMFWDATNSRLGIGTNAPAAALTINSAATLVTGIRFDNAGSIGTIFGDGTSMNIRSGNTHGIQVNSGSASLVQSIASVGGFRIDLQTLTTSPIYSYNGDGDTGIGRAAADTLTFYAGGEKARIFSTGNLLLQNGGTFTDSGERLQVTGNAKIVGSGNTSATTGLLVQNSDATNIFRVYNNGSLLTTNSILFGNNTATGIILSNNQSTFTSGAENITFYWDTTNSIAVPRFTFRGGAKTNTSGTSGLVSFDLQNFTPTSGTGIYNIIVAGGTINQTGGANGITRGLYVNPTLTAAADFRAIETARGNVVFGNLPTSSAGLPTGAIWNDAGTIKIV
jgi:nitrogen fixation protein